VLLVIAGLMLLQAAWILTIPPFRGADEFDHAYRAAAVAGGEWVAGPAAEDGRGLLVEVPESLVTAAHDQCASLDYTGPDNCSPAAEVSDGRVLVASGAAGYYPAFYWVVGTAAAPFEGATALYAMRITAAALCLLFLGLAVVATRALPGRWPMAGLLLAATPVLIYSTTLPAPNGLEMSAALALWTSLMAIAQNGQSRAETTLLWVAIVSAMVLGSLRLIGPIFMLLIVATVAALQWRGIRDVIRRRTRTVLVGSLLVGASVASFAAWILGLWTHTGGGSSEEKGRGALRVSDLVAWPFQTIAAFPLRNETGAAIVYPVVLALVVLLLMFATRRSTLWDRTVMYGSLALALLLPVVLTLATLEGRGVIWQGRYGLPYAVGFILIASYLASQRGGNQLPWKVTVPALTLYGVAIGACLLKVRGNELSNNQASRSDATWHAPWPLLLVALTAAAMVVFLIALSRRSDEPA
jgi:hypothetical protein